jgi:TRAP transporter TatT component family protein
MRATVRLASVIALLFAVPACSLRSVAVRTMADALSRGSSVYASDDDPEFVRQALPFGLKTLEGMAVELPRHRPLLRSLASGFTSYAVAYAVPEARRLEGVNMAAARAERLRARSLLLRGRDYGLRALEVGTPKFAAQLSADPGRAVSRTKRADVPDLYWTAAAWGSAIAIGKDQMNLVADVPIVEALIRRAEALDEAWGDGAVHEFLIAFECRGAAMGGSLARAREHFARAMQIGGERRLGTLVALAENVSVQEGNRQEFDALLVRVLAFDVNSEPDVRLANVLAQHRARQLVAIADELFMKEIQ